MSDRPEFKVLVILNGEGEIDTILTDPPADIMYLDGREISDEHNSWYARDTLVEAQRWPESWHTELDATIAHMIKLVEEAGIEPPEWLIERRTARLQSMLAEIEALTQ